MHAFHAQTVRFRYDCISPGGAAVWSATLAGVQIARTETRIREGQHLGLVQ